MKKARRVFGALVLLFGVASCQSPEKSAGESAKTPSEFDRVVRDPTLPEGVVPGKLPVGGVKDHGPDSEPHFVQWVEHHVARIRPLAKAQALAYWNATASGKKEDYDASATAELALKKIYSNREEFAYVKKIRAAGTVKDPIHRRELEQLYLGFLGNQFDEKLMEKIVQMSTDIEGRFNTYRSDVDGKKLTDNDVEDVLKKSTSSEERRKVWEASKGIGAAVSKDLIALVKLRNEAARQLGYDNYYVLSLALGEQDEAELFRLLDDMADRTEAPFREVKADLDAALAKRYAIRVDELRPWHYEDRFFQESPSVGSVDLDPFYKGKDPVELAAQFYDSIGLPAREVIGRSDLYGREGKYQHAYCTDIDKEGDVRVMESAKDDAYWMDTVLHELGHAVYSLGHDRNQQLPYLLRDAAHTLTTEGFAELTGRLAENPYWMKRFGAIDDAKLAELEPKLRRKTRMGALVFARWCQVMAHFEQGLYRDPDQDLNALWWKNVSKYQMLVAPEGRNAPDWASKIHLVSSPVYYHNYLLGELYAAQLHARICKTYFPGKDPYTVAYSDNKEVGRYLNEKVFSPGAMWKWDRFTVESTGEPLSAKAFADAYVSAPKN